MNYKKILLSIVLVVLVLFSHAQHSPSSEILSKIKNEGYQNSQAMAMLTELTDVYGQRLTGSHEYFEAAQWMLNKMEDLGFEDTHFENFCENCRGWSINSFNVEMIAPNFMNISAYPLAMTKSSSGIVEGEIVVIAGFGNLDLIKKQWGGKLTGKIVLLGPQPKKKLLEESYPKPIDEHRLQSMQQLLTPTRYRTPLPETLDSWEMNGSKEMQFLQFVQAEGVLAVLKSASARFGALRVDGTYYYRRGDLKPLPFFAIISEHFSRLLRLTKQNITPKIRLNLDVEHYIKPENNVNIVGELTGNAKFKSESVLIGAHFDSWHAATGANDNGAGSIVLVEALRILKAIGYSPKRTIRVILWGGEEQALLGSVSYAKKHFGVLDKPNIESNKVSAYLNLDNGSGSIRGIHLQQNEFARPVFERIFETMNSPEAYFVSIENTFSTDHYTFDHYNIPAFQFIQNPTPNAHTQLDLLEYVSEEDVMKNAVIMAWTIYSISEMGAMVPRKK